MSTSYSACPKEIYTRVEKMMAAKPDLVIAEVAITCLFAQNDDGPALSHHGWPARAIIRKNSLRDRVAGLRDVTLLIDRQGWLGLTDIQQTALLDHEITHIEIARDKNGEMKTEDDGRPQIRLLKHDFQIGGFHSMVERYGKDSLEAVSWNAVTREWKQGQFEWMEEEEEALSAK